MSEGGNNYFYKNKLLNICFSLKQQDLQYVKSQIILPPLSSRESVEL